MNSTAFVVFYDFIIGNSLLNIPAGGDSGIDMFPGDSPEMEKMNVRKTARLSE